jgi:hypothetical protein
MGGSRPASISDAALFKRTWYRPNWGTLPLGAAPLPVRSLQRRGFSFRLGGLPVSGSDHLRAAVRAVHAGECVARSDVPSDHALVTSLDGLMPCEILKLMAAAIASQLVILRLYFGKLICSAPSPRLFDYPFSFPDHIVGIICLVTFGVFSLRSEFFLVERQRRFGEL